MPRVLPFSATRGNIIMSAGSLRNVAHRQEPKLVYPSDCRLLLLVFSPSPAFFSLSSSSRGDGVGRGVLKLKGEGVRLVNLSIHFTNGQRASAISTANLKRKRGIHRKMNYSPGIEYLASDYKAYNVSPQF
jgi:hypothetical protein